MAWKGKFKLVMSGLGNNWKPYLIFAKVLLSILKNEKELYPGIRRIGWIGLFLQHCKNLSHLCQSQKYRHSHSACPLIVFFQSPFFLRPQAVKISFFSARVFVFFHLVRFHLIPPLWNSTQFLIIHYPGRRWIEAWLQYRFSWTIRNAGCGFLVPEF